MGHEAAVNGSVQCERYMSRAASAQGRTSAADAQSNAGTAESCGCCNALSPGPEPLNIYLATRPHGPSIRTRLPKPFGVLPLTAGHGHSLNQGLGARRQRSAW